MEKRKQQVVKIYLKTFIIVLISVLFIMFLAQFIPFKYRDYQKALNDAESALKRSSDAKSRYYALTEAVEAAAEIGHFEKAKTYAEELLQLSSSFRDNWNYGNAIHYGHIALGIVALHQGDIEGAKIHLLEAGRTPGSPQLNTAGPDMTLARKLLKRGERDIVLRYLEQCGRFWKSGRSKLILWSWEVKIGFVPAFNRF